MSDPKPLISRYLAGSLTPAEHVELEDWIKEDPDHVAEFVADTFVAHSLHDLMAAQSLAAENESATVPMSGFDNPAKLEARQDRRQEWPRVFPIKGWTFGGLAAAVILLGVFMLGTGSEDPAHIVRTVNAKWKSSSDVQSSILTTGQQLELESGLACIEFACDAYVVLEGPAALRIDSDTKLTLTQGSLVATCGTEKSHGFIVSLPGAEIVDLGTEFGVRVLADGNTLAHVFAGSVEVHAIDENARSSTTLTLNEHESTSIAPGGTPMLHSESLSEKFVRLADLELERRLAEQAISRRAADAFRKLADDPTLLVWSDMYVGNDYLSLSNLSRAGAEGGNLLKVDAENLFAGGRSPNNRSLEVPKFGRPVELDVPGQFADLTLAAWVKFDSESYFDRVNARHRGLVLSDWNQPGHIHWQRKGDSFRLSVVSEKDEDVGIAFEKFVASDAQVTPGTWHLLVSVVDASSAGLVSHYLDGQLVGRQAITGELPPLVLGKCGVGGWRTRGKTDRSLNGCIDDLFIWSRALSASEISELFQWGAH